MLFFFFCYSGWTSLYKCHGASSQWQDRRVSMVGRFMVSLDSMHDIHTDGFTGDWKKRWKRPRIRWKDEAGYRWCFAGMYLPVYFIHKFIEIKYTQWDKILCEDKRLDHDKHLCNMNSKIYFEWGFNPRSSVL